MAEGSGSTRPRNEVLNRLAALRQHQQGGRRSPHKPLLVLLALRRLSATGSSALPWTDAQTKLGSLIEEFGPASKTSRVLSQPWMRVEAARS